ncbi:MAG: MarR family transcriptional regulator [Dehalococcoidia bacterium]|nr:MarR family transcriptional regulator [Dehalococcoidia bacterium]
MTGEALPPEAAWFDSWRGIVFTHARMLDEIGRRLEQHSGISLAFLDVLGRLYDAPDRRLRMQELQRRSLFTRSGMTRVVDRIEEAGLVQRERVPGDRRGVWVVITSKGVRTYEAAMRRHTRDIEEVFGGTMSEAEHRAVGDALWWAWHDEEPVAPPA